MTCTNRAARGAAVLSGIALALAATLVVPAAASADSAWPNDTFRLCTAQGCGGQAIGGVVWGNRTSTVQGTVADFLARGTTVYFEAYAGATKIDSETRTASAHDDVPYHFSIGDPDRVGGFDRLKITVCESGKTYCTVPVNADRDDEPEYFVQE
ncbi:hypothetical protein Amsp01_076100 [Amycolatopsis sp. NBRC 101858]|uniref:hypothetical protein n=1 Tax=Amycolatopsis sp. NBRC 101858 TaxID=3032200 RepID=UPI0024A0EE06|nr:hypothetical protein [Amycolatopsis sp. NBRC 101858]GLY41587.1 hypothetical protein Amsp01_076100 [Amycolatopsis sp. NBRC 101858]